jgi:lipoyl(octanoyl) transferase
MALDDALMARARRTGDGVVRVYEWATPTLSLGRNQRARGIYTAERAAEAGVSIVRRPTGGRALLHHREITYSVSAPAPTSLSLTTSYRAINALLLDALRALGVDAQVAESSERFPPPASAPCFERPAPGELIARGRKLVGSAQYREQGAMLQHGSILVHDDQALVVRLAATPVGAPAPAASLAELLGYDLSAAAFAEALFSAVRRAWHPGATALREDAQLLRDVEAAQQRYTDAAWTWRR